MNVNLETGIFLELSFKKIKQSFSMFSQFGLALIVV